MIIDCHIHLHCPEGDQRDVVARLLRCMDRLGIDCACMSLGARTIVRPTVEELRGQNEWVASSMALAPDRFIGLIYASPLIPEASLAEIAEFRQRGFRGIKLGMCELADHPGNGPICELAGQLGLPVLQHTWFKATGNLPNESHASHLVRLAQRHPQTNFIMAHAGGDWERGLRSAKDYRNIYADTSGCDPEAGMVELGVRLLGAQRLLFGSDVNVRSFASQMGKITGAAISDEHKRLILGENLLRLMPS